MTHKTAGINVILKAETNVKNMPNTHQDND